MSRVSNVWSKFKQGYRDMALPAKAGFWFVVCSIVQRGISVISMPIFTRLMTTDQYGQYSLYMSWYAIISIVVTLKLYQEVFNKGLSDHGENRDRYASSQLGLTVCLGIVFLLVYLLLRNPINALTGLTTELTVVAIVEGCTGSIVDLWYARKRFEYVYRPVVAVTTVISVLSVGLGIVGVYLAPDAYKVLVRALTNAGVPAIAACACAVSFLRKSSHLFDGTEWKRSLGLLLPLLPHYLALVLLRQTGTIVIGRFIGDAAAGIYSIGVSAGFFLVLVNDGINSSFVPWLYGRLRDKRFEEVAPITNLLCLLVVGVNLLLMLLAPEIVFLLAAEEYQAAVWCIPPIAASAVASFVYTLFVNVEVYYGKTAYASTASIVATIFNVAFNIMLVPMFGYIAAAYVSEATYLVMAFLHVVFYFRALKASGNASAKIFDVRALLLLSVGALVAGAVCLGLYQSTILRIGVLAFILILIWALRGRIARVLQPITRKHGK